jgi:hypothetical protein
MLRNMLFVLLCCGQMQALSANEDVAPGQPDKYGVIQKPVLADTPEKFVEQTQRIHEDMQVGGRYEYITPSDRRTVDRLLEQMESLLQHAGSVDAMNQTARIELFNDQEQVNGILKHNDSNRLICESRAPIGSNILKTTCHTHGQIEATARNTKEGLMEFDHSRLCNGPNPENGCSPNLNRPNNRGH